MIPLFFFLFCAAILMLTLRGLPGNPIAEELNTTQWKENGPFELSPERGRFTLLYSMAEDGSFQFSRSLAEFASPDLVVSPSGKYVSMFAPGVSFLVLPGYIIGKYFSIAQVGSFAIISFFALLNIILIRAIAIRLGSDPIAAAAGAFAFAFATPAFSYAGTLYQHHVTVFIILSSIYALMQQRNFASLAYIWFMVAFSVAVDNPNVFFMLPIAIYALGKIVMTKNEINKFIIEIKLFRFVTLFAMVLPIMFFLWFNASSNEDPFRLSGTLPSAQSASSQSGTGQSDPDNPSDSVLEAKSRHEKDAIGLFKTRNLTNGFYIHFLSPDRGMINYAPIVLFGIFGIVRLYRKNYYYANLIVAIIGFNVLLYSMWGDPYGGWAFGSRYLIPTYAMLGIGIGIFLTQWRKNTAILIIFFAVFVYSARVNTLGALTSIANPPKIEVLALEKITGKEQKYTYERNQKFLEKNGSKSFVFQAYLKNDTTAQEYFSLVYGLVIVTPFFLLLSLRFSHFDFSKILLLARRR